MKGVATVATDTFRNLEKVCLSLGLAKKACKNGLIYSGIGYNGEYSKIIIHKHAGGRNIPTGLFNRYVKDLGFQSTDDYFNFK